MGGFGSGRRGGGPTVESTVKLDIDWMMRSDAIQPGCRVTGEMHFRLYDAPIDVKFESETRNGAHGWLRLRYKMTDYWSGAELEIDDKVYLETTRPHFGGLRWWFICPYRNRRVRALFLPLGGLTFGAGVPMGSITPPSERANLTGLFDVLGSCTTGLAVIRPMTSTQRSRRECVGRRTSCSWTSFSLPMRLWISG
jgi:hypothetical protein